MSKKDQAVRLDEDTNEKLKNLDITVWGVNLESWKDKIKHLIWFYESYKNNNKDK